MSKLYHKSDMPHTDTRAFYTSLYISGMFFLSACFVHWILLLLFYVALGKTSNQFVQLQGF